MRGGFIAREENKTLLDQLLRHKASVPGVGAYAAEVVEDKQRTLGGQVRSVFKITLYFGSLARQGGRLDQSARVQEVEAIMNKAAKLPGPGQYALLADLIGPAACARPHALAGVRVQRPPSAVVTGRGVTTLDSVIKASAVSPGPCRSPNLKYMHNHEPLTNANQKPDYCRRRPEHLTPAPAPADTTR